MEAAGSTARKVGRAAGIACALLGGIVLVGWAFDWQVLKSLHPALVSMKPNSAFCFLCLGTALAVVDAPRSRVVIAILASIAGAVAAATMFEYASGRDLGIDQLLFRDDVSADAGAPGRMAMTTAIGFLLCTGAIALLDLEVRGRRPGHWLAWAAGASAFLGFVGYTNGVTRFWGMAMHTVLGFLVLSAGLFLVRPDREPLATLRSATGAGLLARRLLPVVLIAPTVFGCLTLAGSRAALYDGAFGASLLVVSSVVLLVSLTSWATSSLRRSELAQAAAYGALVEREQNLATTLDSIADAVIATDADGRIVRMNQVAQRLTGWSFEEALAQPLERIFRTFDEEHGIAKESPVVHVLREGAVVALASHTALETREGQRIPIVDSGAPIRGPEGALLGVVLVFRDMSEARQRENAVRESEARYRAVVESALDCIVAMDRDGIVIEFNPAAEATFGYSREEALGRPLSELIVPPAVRAQHVAGLARLRATGEARILGRRLELVAMRSDGTELPVELTIAKASTEGAPELFTGFIRDLTERREAEAARVRSTELEELNLELTELTVRLDDANRELESFSYAVSHDLRAPLRGLDGFSLALIEDYGDRLDERAHDYLHRIRSGAQRMGHIIDDLLRLARVARADFAMEQVDVSLLARAAASEIARAHDRTVTLTVAPGIVARADARLLRLALDNLIDNAWKFTSRKADARVEVGSTVLDGEQVFFVKDNGAGFDMKHASRLFTPFQRIHRDTEFAGTGIGLATVARVVQRHGGRIWAEARPDEGATFFFTLTARSAS
jgi:PAS domain S-box-containing protein